MRMLDIVKEAVDEAYIEAWGRPVGTFDPQMLHKVCVARRDAPNACDIGEGCLAVIYTEYGNLTQYNNDEFWEALQEALEPRGLYYEWQNGGCATIWPIT